MKVAYVPCVSQTPGTVWGPEAAWGEGRSVRGGRAPSKGAAGFVHELQIRKKHLAPNKSSVTCRSQMVSQTCSRPQAFSSQKIYF